MRIIYYNVINGIGILRLCRIDAAECGGKVDYVLELLLISENKIKISLTKEDLDGHGITSDDLDYDNTETRRVFWTLLDEVKGKTGFDAAKTRIFIQIYPLRDGGCELYVSKIKDAERVSAAENGRFCYTGIKKRYGKDGGVFRFDEIEQLLLVCRRLKVIGYRKRASVFSEGKTRFFLSLEEYGERCSFISEYGEKQDAEASLLYIREHCETICSGDAVERLGVL